MGCCDRNSCTLSLLTLTFRFGSVDFVYGGTEDDDKIDMVFNKERVADRKEFVKEHHEGFAHYGEPVTCVGGGRWV